MKKSPTAYSFALLLFCALFVASCSGKMGRVMQKSETLQTVKIHLGEPDSSTELADGTIRHEWRMDRMMTLPGHYETWCPRFFNRDRFPKCSEYDIWIAPRQERQTCSVTVIADKNGKVLHSRWEGDHCSAMVSDNQGKSLR